MRVSPSGKAVASQATIPWVRIPSPALLRHILAHATSRATQTLYVGVAFMLYAHDNSPNRQEPRALQDSYLDFMLSRQAMLALNKRLTFTKRR